MLNTPSLPGPMGAHLGLAWCRFGLPAPPAWPPALAEQAAVAALETLCNSATTMARFASALYRGPGRGIKMLVGRGRCPPHCPEWCTAHRITPYQPVMTQIDNMTDAPTTGRPVDAELLVAPGCAHCPGVLDALGKLVKEGLIGRLTVTNIASYPEAAAAVGTRSVPWVRIGPYALEGTHTPAELRDWVEQAAAGGPMGGYLAYLLEQQQLPRVVAMIEDSPALLHDLVPLLGDLETPMGVRIGIGAVFEDLQDSGLLAQIVDELGALTRDKEPQVRADACHYLGLTADAGARRYVTPLLEDADAEVREIAAESLPLLPAE